MTASGGTSPGGVPGSGPGGGRGTYGRKAHGSWAEMLGSTLPSGLNKNILEIVLDKDRRGAFVVSDTDCARLIRKLGVDPRPGVQVEAVQICPGGKGVILITLRL